MNRATDGRVRSALLAALLTFGSAGAVLAQQLGNPAGGKAGTTAPTTTTGNTAVGGVTGIGTGVSPSAMQAPGMSAGGSYGLGSGGETGSGAALNNMRANGTALYMNPDPRAPNVTGRAAPPR
ncbi:hypothetical protein CI15_31010 [Paraburkholderia monticola]|uniref:Uncharacterized protein n=1 Tax=Paraburkholderia monticola TaxID=1399968 RepID=A0A149PEV0_9BURK|nr:hypothetical protein [Paraburkholderia monticola]KXU83585.1 hypothetical protein CI15_31010 [Paraburkholderia monticola]